MDVLSTLKEKNLITDEELAKVEQSVQEEGINYEQALRATSVSKDAIRDAFSAYYGIPSYVLAEEEEISQRTLGYIPEDSARHYKIIPLKVEDGVLLVGINDPENLQTRDVLNFISNKYGVPYKLMFMLADDLDEALQEYENLSGEVDEALTSLESELSTKPETDEKREEAKAALEHMKEDAPVTKIVATILRYAVDGSASDIHIEPGVSKITVRFRVDGLLQTSLELPKKVHAAVVARIKILSSLRLDERRKPQDGRFSATFDDRKIDFRVSVLPTNHGEKVVMRILDTAKGVNSLENTGISAHNLDSIKRMVNEPYGIILISGPTGSGKSTTLYAMLEEIDKQSKNVLSLEDPVEYDIEGVSQSQVRPEIGYTFATGLRSALRQDPDVILVGEIRDKETARLAIQAALTGHLVLSTIHTNNSIGVIPRLIDMGIDPYLIAPTLKLAIAQRLARRICPGTGEEVPVDESLKMMIEKEFETLPQEYHSRIPEPKSILHPEPSPGCASGTKGRIAITESLEVNDEIEHLILNNASEEEIYQVARKHGFMSMKEDALIKAIEHTIPFEEANAFGTKVGEENVFHEEEEQPADSTPPIDTPPVDNPPPEENSHV